MTERDDHRIKISNETRRLIHSEIKRTGVTAIMLLNSALAPADLTPRDVNRWSSKLQTSARHSDIDYVLKAWAALPDRTSTARAKRGRPHDTPAAGRIEITDEMVAMLRSEFERAWSDYRSVLEDAADVPPSLTPRVIRSWLKRAVRAKPEHWEYVIGRLAALPDHLNARRPSNE